VAYVENNLK
jgi:hypothetical protein